MRYGNLTITPATIRRHAEAALRPALPWRGFGRSLNPALIIAILLLAACRRRSLSATVKSSRFGCSHETARKAVRANLDAAGDGLNEGLLRALHHFRSPRMSRRKWAVAIDEHRAPFYGDRHAPGVSGGQKKHGSKYAYAYATAVIVHRRHRYTVGLMPVEGRKPHEVVGELLGQLARHRVGVRGVVLDSAYDSARTILLLQGLRLSYAVPMRRKGGKKGNRRDGLWDLPEGTRTSTRWEAKDTKLAVRTDVVVATGADGRKRVWAYGGWSWCRDKAAAAVRWYRRRFGIETSYRQMRQAQAMTSGKDARYRLLLIGVALVLRQAWVWLTGLIAAARGYGPKRRVSELSLADMLGWLGEALRHRREPPKLIDLGPQPSKPG